MGAGLTYTPAGGRTRRVAGTVQRVGADRLLVRFLPGAIGARYASLRWQVSSSLTTAGCTTAKTAGCRQLLPTAPTLAVLHVPRLVGFVPGGPSYVTNGSRAVHEVAFT